MYCFVCGLHTNALGKSPEESADFGSLAILMYEASKTSPSGGWVAAHSRSRYGYVGTIMHVYPRVIMFMFEHVMCVFEHVMCMLEHVIRMFEHVMRMFEHSRALAPHAHAMGRQADLADFNSPQVRYNWPLFFVSRLRGMKDRDALSVDMQSSRIQPPFPIPDFYPRP